MTSGLRQVLEQLHQAGGLTDGQLLARFVAARDETAFAALVRRHGPMVLGVCRRVVGDFHDAEDAFQATFLVLASRAASVLKRESVGCWLHGVAYHTALRATTALGRRRSREKPMSDLPHPQTQPDEPRDWLPLLDRELSLLPEKYRAAIVACDLEGRPRREAARVLGLSEGTVSSRLARGRALLAKRLTRCGVALSGGALAVALSNEASAAVPAGLVSSTAKAAALTAAGQVAAVSTTTVLLMKGVTRMMLLKKLRVVAGAVVVLLAFGAVGVGYRAGGSGVATAAPPDKPGNELEALRRENDLLKLNLEVVLEKVRAQEAELRELRPRKEAGLLGAPGMMPGRGLGVREGGGAGPVAPGANQGVPGMSAGGMPPGGTGFPRAGGPGPVVPGAAPGVPGMGPGGMGASPSMVQPDALQEAEAAIKAIRQAKDEESRRRATEGLEQALEKLRQPANNKPRGR